MTCFEFYGTYCEETEDSRIVLLPTLQNKLKIDTENSSQHSITMENVFRYVNPKVDAGRFLFIHTTETDDVEDFDEAVSIIDCNSQKYDLDFTQIEKYFLPSNLEKILKDVLYGGKTKGIPEILRKYLPEELINNRQLEFQTMANKTVEYCEASKYSISLFKTFKEASIECNFDETIEKINEIKTMVRPRFIEAFDYFFLGDVQENDGLFEKKKTNTFPNPLTFHYNFWILENTELKQFCSMFELQKFE